jgi:hypothetical protein
MSVLAIVVLAFVGIWLVGMLLAAVRRSRRARAASLRDQPRHRSRAEESRTAAAVRNES